MGNEMQVALLFLWKKSLLLRVILYSRAVGQGPGEEETMKKVWMLAAAAGLCAMVMAGCGGAADKGAAKEAPAAKVLKVGTDATFPPFEYHQAKSGAYTGFDIELMDGVAKTMGYDKVEIVDTHIGTIEQDLADKKFDVALRCLAVTDRRKELMDFTDPYLMGAYGVAVPARQADSFEESRMKEKKIAVEKDSAPERLLRSMGYTEFELTASNEDALRRVASGAADAAVMSKYTIAFYEANGYGKEIKAVPGLYIGGEVPIAMAVRKGDKELLEKVNSALKEYKGTTLYGQLKKTYFGDVK